MDKQGLVAREVDAAHVLNGIVHRGDDRGNDDPVYAGGRDVQVVKKSSKVIAPHTVFHQYMRQKKKGATHLFSLKACGFRGDSQLFSLRKKLQKSKNLAGLSLRQF